jgi:hypothetical protein
MKMIFILKEYNGIESKIFSRFMWFSQGVCELIDGLILVLSFGFFASKFSYEFSKLRMIRYIKRQRLKSLNRL